MTEKEMITKVVIETLAPLGVVRIAVFGSFVRQDFGPQSDIDILVWLPSLGKRKTIGLRWFSLDQEIEKIIGRHVDFGFYSLDGGTLSKTQKFHKFSRRSL